MDIDLTGVSTREGFHEKIRQALALPDWYGNNLDALHDVLTDRPELSLRLLHAEQLPPQYIAALERMSEDSNGQLCIVNNPEQDGAID